MGTESVCSLQQAARTSLKAAVILGNKALRRDKNLHGLRDIKVLRSY